MTTQNQDVGNTMTTQKPKKKVSTMTTQNAGTIFQAIVQQAKHDISALHHLPKECREIGEIQALLDDPKFMLDQFKKDEKNIGLASARLLDDAEFIWSCVKAKSTDWVHEADALKDHKHYVALAISDQIFESHVDALLTLERDALKHDPNGEWLLDFIEKHHLEMPAQKFAVCIRKIWDLHDPYSVWEFFVQLILDHHQEMPAEKFQSCVDGLCFDDLAHLISSNSDWKWQEEFKGGLSKAQMQMCINALSRKVSQWED